MKTRIVKTWNRRGWIGLLAAPMLALGVAAAVPAQPADSAGAPPAYGRGYGPGHGMGSGMMGGWAGGYGGWGGMGPGMMGGWGDGYGPGMMNGWGGSHGGWGMGPGMMGGYGGWGRGPRPSDAQIQKIEAIEKALLDKQWPLMRSAQQTMIDSWSAGESRLDIDAVMKKATTLSNLHLQMLRNRLEAQQQIDAVLAAEQRPGTGKTR
ncbi:MAG: hypothetical protein OJF60_001251 [Burkholderiaceae bacterium]|nr:MAG: hypothetical protein OJF60_001251 [Burkholderiaceae bacterium]